METITLAKCVLKGHFRDKVHCSVRVVMQVSIPIWKNKVNVSHVKLVHIYPIQEEHRLLLVNHVDQVDIVQQQDLHLKMHVFSVHPENIPTNLPQLVVPRVRIVMLDSFLLVDRLNVNRVKTERYNL